MSKQREKKLDIIRNIYWDYNIDPDYYLNLAEHPENADKNELRKFFVRAFEHTRWHEFVNLFSADTILNLNTDETRKLIRKEAVDRFDAACRLLQRQPISTTRQDIENRKLALKPLLSNRWYSVKQGVS